MCDSVNHTRFPKEDHLPDWARRDNNVTNGDRVEPVYNTYEFLRISFWQISLFAILYWGFVRVFH